MRSIESPCSEKLSVDDTTDDTIGSRGDTTGDTTNFDSPLIVDEFIDEALGIGDS